MIRRTTLLLLALLCLATTIGPAVADTPTTATPPANPTIYDEIRAGRPGSLEKWQLQQMRSMLIEGIRAFQIQTGSMPATVDALLEAGLLPYQPILTPGIPRQIVPLDASELPPPDAVGIRLRDTDCRLIQLGADGDPLAPLIQSISVNPAEERWPLEYPWRARQATLLQAQLLRLCSAYFWLIGDFPVSPEALYTTFQMMPVGASWLTDEAVPECGVQVEFDTTGSYVRMTRYPDPGYEQATTFAFLPNSSGIGYRSTKEPWFPALALTWRDLRHVEYYRRVAGVIGHLECTRARIPRGKSSPGCAGNAKSGGHRRSGLRLGWQLLYA